MRYAEVIVDLSAGAVDRRFTYAVPDGMRLDAGWQVEVPFGPRTLEGYVIALKEECGLPSEKVKDVRRALEDGTLSAYAADVLTVEPPREGNPLLGAPNCILTPHIAWAPLESRTRLMNTAVSNLRAYLEGTARNVVAGL